jgi:hypothetical protein
MQIKSFRVWAIACLAAHTTILHAQEDIPDDFSSRPVIAAGAYDLAKACMPSTTQDSFNTLVRDAGNLAAISWPADKTESFVVIAKNTVFCVKRSSHGKPIMPLTMFDGTIVFPGMDKDETRKFRTDLSRQLATVGFASALVINDSGNAWHIAYMFNGDTPTKLYYHAGFLKQGEFNESQFPTLYRTSGGMSISGRGRPSEFYKSFFQ